MFFSLKEAFRLIGRAKASFILSLISLSISIILITSSIMLVQLSGFLQKRITEDISINLFLNDNLSSEQVSGIKIDLQNRDYIRTTEYISKDKAAKIFIKETGEDFRDLLKYNPLPSSFTITLKENYVQRDSLKAIVNSLSNLKGVNDISFKDEYIYKLISILNNLKKYIFITTIIIFFISLYIVYSTVRLIISSRFEELETMKLVGAKLFTIKLPVILNLMIAGFLAGLIAAIFFMLFIYVFGNYFNLLNFVDASGYIYLYIIISMGPVLVLLVSNISLGRLSLKI